MSEEEKKFLEIVDLKKGFGSGQTRQEVLRGMNFSVAKGVPFGRSGDGERSGYAFPCFSEWRALSEFCD